MNDFYKFQKNCFRGFLLLIVFFGIFSIALKALAADFEAPQADVAAILLNLALNYKTIGVIGIISGLILVSVQTIKAFAPDDWKYKRLTTLIFSIIYSVISGLLVPGSNFITVIVTVFLSSGGAVALYEALKGVGFIKKPT